MSANAASSLGTALIEAGINEPQASLASRTRHTGAKIEEIEKHGCYRNKENGAANGLEKFVLEHELGIHQRGKRARTDYVA